MFLSVNTFAKLLVPTLVIGNFAVAGVNVACAMPVPDRATVCGLPTPLSFTDRVPVRAPS